jgi:hypothetical protein
MKLINISFKNIFVGLTLTAIVIISSCKKYVEIPVAPSMLSNAESFSSDSAATSAVLSIYSTYNTYNAEQYFTYAGGLAADELQNTQSDAQLGQFSKNQVLKTNSDVESFLWAYPYTIIRFCNLSISQIAASTGMSQAAKNQLTGEAKFMRAWTFFYLVNYFGAVPLSLDATPLNNGNLPRAATADVYNQIIADLKDAQSLLPAAYAGSSAHRSRANKWAAAALLARVYLYTKDYADAKTEAGLVINSGVYTMPDLNSAFINTSTEAIFQFANTKGISKIGSAYRTDPASSTVAPPAYVLYSGFTKSFEAGDNRKKYWVDSTIYNNITYYRINKYKLADQNQGTNEFDVVLRVAEQYLIKAEAEAQLNDATDAQTDLNTVRTRAGLPNTTASTQEALLTAILHERKVEFFGEYGHRWFDLIRTGQADAVLGALKTTWTSTATLMPIPQNEILLNPTLTQNPGY